MIVVAGVFCDDELAREAFTFAVEQTVRMEEFPISDRLLSGTPEEVCPTRVLSQTWQSLPSTSPPRSASCATSCHKHFKRNFLQPSWIRNLICAVSLARVTQIEPLEACLVSWGSFFFMKRIVLGKLITNADPSTFPGLTWQILQYCCWQSFIFLNFAAVPLFIPWPHWSCANLRTKWATARHLPSVLVCVCRICSTAISTQLFSYKGNSANIKTQQNISIITITVIVISS